MPSKITGDIIDALQHCRLKAHFLLCGEQGIQSGYEKLQIEQRVDLRHKTIEKIRHNYSKTELVTGLNLSVAELRKGAALVLGAHLENDRYAVQFDALRKIDGFSALGSFRYEPVLFSAAPRILALDRNKLATRAVLLATLQGAIPNGGTVYLGRNTARTSIRFGSALAPAENLLRDAERLLIADTPPKLRLNEHCPICSFRDRCRDQAIREDSLSLLRGIGEKAVKRYARKGILTLTQLAHTFRPRRRGKRADTALTGRDHALHALAIRDRTIYVLGAPTIPTATVRIYVDMEGDIESGIIYLIGLIVSEGEHTKRYSFWADDEKAEVDIFARFLDIVAQYDAPLLYCYGNYERVALARMQRRARRKKPIVAILGILKNVLTIIYPHFYFPTHSNGLKETAGCLGCRWTEPDASGLQSIVWRKNWERTGDASWKAKLIEYNLEDCEALRKICAFLAEAPNCTASGQPNDAPRVASVAELDKLARTATWSKFVQADFDFVNKRAYFDYQQRHVFVRMKPVRRKRSGHKEARRWQNRDLRVTHRMEITATRCPACSSRRIVPLDSKQRPKGLQRRRKRAIDLIIKPEAIRRKVLEFRTIAYRCEACSKCFIPERYDRLIRYFHGLMSWFAYQHITHRLGLRSVAALFYETFKIRVNFWEFADFRHLLVHKYRKTYNMLLAQLKAGQVLYVDETEIKLKDGGGYVWVFASTVATVYIFRRSRDGGFLRPLLKNFKGVLVSDFYSAYDGLPCSQQRCLIHLMRDMNRAILDNPFDKELESITSPFGAILRSIVVTIDEHGLKHRYLRAHVNAVEIYFASLADHFYESDSAKTLKERLLKNRHRLFTFLQHDDVAWNNNLAENAVKRISDYREDAGQSVKEAGLIEQLVLLSLYQTCRVRDISFLSFLLSQERDIDAFMTSKGRRRRAAHIEFYPKGYLPPSITSLRRGRTVRGSDGTAAEND